MALTLERFEQGMTYEQFKAQMTRNQERFAENERKLTLDPSDVAAFTNLPQTLHVLVLAEDWCGDVIDNLPVLGRLAQESGKLDLRIFLRDQHPDLMDQYLNQGQFRSIPVFALLDDSFQELGRFIERPASVTERRAQRRRELHDGHPEYGDPQASISQLPEEARAGLMQAMASMREETKAQDNADVVRALREIVEHPRA
jgi:hypothetical protein